MDCRTTHSSHEVVFKGAEGYAVVRQRLKRLLTGDAAVTWDADTGIYVKATVNARQREYKRVPDDDQAFNQFFSAIWANPKRRHELRLQHASGDHSTWSL
ncbi:unnamed protein product [Phytophthora fragariaefolia]|uniref:Unnamed protein product n=1 Tax=Phytophthora fragariaefolia TaxID=1490495 RepID=A0A9W7CWY3_9STRA|nr:unnamed protein product [Phytophthora fragariaefolia]